MAVAFLCDSTAQGDRVQIKRKWSHPSQNTSPTSAAREPSRPAPRGRVRQVLAYSCDVWHHRCGPVTAPTRLSRDSLQRPSKSSAFHGAREKYKLIKTVAILDGWFSYLLDSTILIHQVFVASVWELLSQLFSFCLSWVNNWIVG